MIECDFSDRLLLTGFQTLDEACSYPVVREGKDTAPVWQEGGLLVKESANTGQVCWHCIGFADHTVDLDLMVVAARPPDQFLGLLVYPAIAFG